MEYFVFLNTFLFQLFPQCPDGADQLLNYFNNHNGGLFQNAVPSATSEVGSLFPGLSALPQVYKTTGTMAVQVDPKTTAVLVDRKTMNCLGWLENHSCLGWLETPAVHGWPENHICLGWLETPAVYVWPENHSCLGWLDNRSCLGWLENHSCLS